MESSPSLRVLGGDYGGHVKVVMNQPSGAVLLHALGSAQASDGLFGHQLVPNEEVEGRGCRHDCLRSPPS